MSRGTHVTPAELRAVGSVELADLSLELVSYPGPDGAVVQARGSSGYLEPVLLAGIGPNAAEIIGLFGVLDLNADGTPEVLLDRFGNTARSLVVLEWDGCNIVAATADDTIGEVFRLLVGIGGGSCA